MNTQQLVESSADELDNLAVDNPITRSMLQKTVVVGNKFDMAVLNPPVDTEPRTPDDAVYHARECEPYRIRVEVLTELKQDEEPEEYVDQWGRHYNDPEIDQHIHSFTVKVLKSGGPYHIVGERYYVYGCVNDYWQISHTTLDHQKGALDPDEERDPHVDFGPPGHEPGLYESEHEFDYGITPFDQESELTPGKSYRLRYSGRYNTVEGEDYDDVVYLGKAVLDIAGIDVGDGYVCYFFLTDQGIYYVGTNPAEGVFYGDATEVKVDPPYDSNWSGEMDWPDSYEELDEPLGYPIPAGASDGNGGIHTPSVSEVEDWNPDDYPE